MGNPPAQIDRRTYTYMYKKKPRGRGKASPTQLVRVKVNLNLHPNGFRTHPAGRFHCRIGPRIKAPFPPVVLHMLSLRDVLSRSTVLGSRMTFVEEQDHNFIRDTLSDVVG